MEKKVNYRSIWEKNYGPIPKDENGVSYQIHHIDGNRNNNELNNLMCVSLDEHIEIHKKQKDWASVAFLEQMRGKIVTGWKHSTETKEKIRQNNLENPRRYWLGKKRPDTAERNKLGPSEETKEKQREAKLKNPTKYWLGKSRKGMKQNHPTHECPHCGKIGKGSAMFKWHFDNCKKN
jgi:hypothetical protein